MSGKDRSRTTKPTPRKNGTTKAEELIKAEPRLNLTHCHPYFYTPIPMRASIFKKKF